MATKAETKEFAAPKKASDERVSVFIPRGNPNGDPNYYISINNYTANLPRGKNSLVPQFVKEKIDRQLAAEERLYDEISKREITPEKARFM